MNGWMDGWMDRWMDGWIERERERERCAVDGQMAGRKDRPTKIRTDEQAFIDRKSKKGKG
jgi:hypothetical protein